MTRVLAFLVLLTTPLSAQGWRTALTGAADAAIWVDVAQTLHGLQHGVTETSPAFAGGSHTFDWGETNPILGRHPSTGGLLAYNGVWVAVNTFAPKKLRPFVNVATLLVQGLVISHNTRLVGFRLTP